MKVIYINCNFNKEKVITNHDHANPDSVVENTFAFYVGGGRFDSPLKDTFCLNASNTIYKWELTIDN